MKKDTLFLEFQVSRFLDEGFDGRFSIFSPTFCALRKLAWAFWRSYEFLSVAGRFFMKNDLIFLKFQVSRFLGEEFDRRFSIF